MDTSNQARDDRSEPPGTRIIVFCGTKRMCDQLAMNLSREYRAAAIHGDKKQQERDAVLAAFKVSRRQASSTLTQTLPLCSVACFALSQGQSGSVVYSWCMP